MRGCKISKFWYIILIILAAIYFYFYKYKKYITREEHFISSIYRPHLRHMRLKYEHFMDNYGYAGHKFIMNKF
jgi:hypothetical protein